MDVGVTADNAASAGALSDNLSADNINKELTKLGLPAATVLSGEAVDTLPILVRSTPAPQVEAKPVDQKDLIISVAVGLGGLILVMVVGSWCYVRSRHKPQRKTRKALDVYVEEESVEPTSMRIKPSKKRFAPDDDVSTVRLHPVDVTMTAQGEFQPIDDDLLPGAATSPGVSPNTIRSGGMGQALIETTTCRSDHL